MEVNGGQTPAAATDTRLRDRYEGDTLGIVDCGVQPRVDAAANPGRSQRT